MLSKPDAGVVKTLGPREALLAILYSPDTRGTNGSWNWAAPIEGKTRLVKELFLFDRETGAGRSGALRFTFTPGPYGPSSMALTDALDLMLEKGEIAATPAPDPRTRAPLLRIVGATGAGARSLWATLPTESRRDLYSIKARYRSFTYKRLLAYVYAEYPEFTTSSLIRDEILTDE